MRIKVYLCFLFLVGCSNTHFQERKNILNDTLKASYLDVDNSLKVQRTILSFTGGEKASDCKSYFILNSKYDLDESVFNQLVKSEYLLCDALDILIKSPWKDDKKITSLNLGKKLREQLDFRSFPSSFYRATSDDSYTLESMFPKEVRVGSTTVELQTDDWMFTLEIVALAKINDNSYFDWVVWVSDESKSGNYKSYSTIILYDPEKNTELKAKLYGEH